MVIVKKEHVIHVHTVLSHDDAKESGGDASEDGQGGNDEGGGSPTPRGSGSRSTGARVSRATSTAPRGSREGSSVDGDSGSCRNGSPLSAGEVPALNQNEIRFGFVLGI